MNLRANVGDKIPWINASDRYLDLVSGEIAVAYIVYVPKNTKSIVYGTRFKDNIVDAGAMIGTTAETLKEPETNNDIFLALEEDLEDTYLDKLYKILEQKGFQYYWEDNEEGTPSVVVKSKDGKRTYRIYPPDMDDTDAQNFVNNLIFNNIYLPGVAAKRYFEEDIEEQAKEWAKEDASEAEKNLNHSDM